MGANIFISRDGDLLGPPGVYNTPSIIYSLFKLNINMPKTFAPLPTLSLQAGTGYFHPVELPEVIHWRDPALHAMVDFKYIKAETISSHEAIDTALIAVRNCSYHVLLVIDHDHKILGLVGAEDLLGEKPLQAIQERRLPRADITTQMVMVPQHEIIVLDTEALRHAKVAHIVETLHAHRQHYALVVKIDEESGAQMVRGLFSSSLLSKQLGWDVTSDLSEAHSIAELQHNLHIHD